MPDRTVEDAASKALLESRQALIEALQRLEAKIGPMGDFRVSVGKPRKGRDKGEWVLRVRGDDLPHGRRELTGIPCRSSKKALAEQMAARREAELNGGQALLTVGEVYERWLASVSVLKATRVSRVTTLNRLKKLRLAHAVDGDLHSRGIVAARRELTKKLGLKVSAGRLSLGHIKQAWIWARLEGLVEQDWPQLPTWRTPKDQKCQKRAYTDEELASLMEHVRGYAKGRYLLLFQLLVHTACRIGEACRLHVDDVELHGDHALLHIRKTKTHVARTTLVPLPLGRALLQNAQGGWIFPAQQREGPIHQGNFGPVVRKWVLANGLDGERDVHSIRRWGVGVLHRSGVPIAVAQQVTGHEDPKVFLDYAQRASYETVGAAKILWGAGPVSALDPKWPHVGPQDSGSRGNGPLGGVSETGRVLVESHKRSQVLLAPEDLTSTWTQRFCAMLRTAPVSQPGTRLKAIGVLRSLGPVGSS